MDNIIVKRNRKINTITKKINNNGVTKAPSDYNQSYLNA